ncbi:hypothetical protein RISK_006610 [Rhodopirellula islandica]|uniref:Uncharacterized protein n=1 Tax=Rhodopirellula islandica TaxID=595434 RepID=A0A0J1E7K9_RHOIS|nr:hypothetical protein RISK_006610 [Rhodopirellula islandica]
MSGKRREVVSCRERKLSAIVSFWHSLPDPSELAGMSGRSLADLRREALACLKRSPPDLNGAQAATFQAIHDMRNDEQS